MKRKTGYRYPCGKLKGPNAKERAKTEAEVYRANMQQVAAQPHRHGFRDPLSPRLESALGRLCERMGLRSELFEAGREYAELMRRWRVAKGCPDPVHTGALGNGQGPTEATVAGWWRQIAKIETALKADGKITYLAVRHLCLEESDISPEAENDAVSGLCIVANELGRLPIGAHPFARMSAA